MNYHKDFFTILAFVLCFSIFPATSQELVRPVVTGVPFLQIAPDARSGGIGEAGVATLPGTYSHFHNPAKYLFMQETNRGIGLSYIPQFTGFATDIFHASANYFQRLNPRSAVSGGITYFSYGQVSLEEEMGGQIISQGNFSPNEFAFDAAYSLQLNENFSMSVAGRYIRSSITDDRMGSSAQLKAGQSIAADITGFYNSAPLLHQDKWTAGFSLKNIGPAIEYSSEAGYEYPLPTSIKLGAGYHLAFGEQDYLSFYAETMKFLVLSTDDERNIPEQSAIGGIFSSFSDAPGGFSEEMKEFIYSFGSEYNLRDQFKLRAGFITQNEEKGSHNHLTVGAGAAWENFLIDLAYKYPISDRAASIQDKVLRISLSYSFNSIN